MKVLNPGQLIWTVWHPCILRVRFRYYRDDFKVRGLLYIRLLFLSDIQSYRHIRYFYHLPLLYWRFDLLCCFIYINCIYTIKVFLVKVFKILFMCLLYYFFSIDSFRNFMSILINFFSRWSYAQKMYFRLYLRIYNIVS